MNLVVTTGATVTFRPLLAKVLSPAFVAEATAAGFTSITVQYGAEIVNGTNVSDAYIASVDVPSQVELVGITNDIPLLLNKASVVVSHAGTGAIIDALRLNKLVVVVPNPALMNNHQQEIATAFTQLGVCMESLVENLTVDLLLQAATQSFPRLPPPHLVEPVLATEFLLST